MMMTMPQQNAHEWRKTLVFYSQVKDFSGIVHKIAEAAFEKRTKDTDNFLVTVE
jgi:hypothetical protein